MVAKTKKSRKSKSKAQPEEMDVAPAKEEVVSASAKKQGKKTKKSAEKSQPKKVTKSKKQKKSKVEEPPPAAESSSGSDEEEEGSDDMKLTLEALDAMSDDDDSEDGDDIGSDGDGGEMSEEDYDAEALALRKMIQDGKFDAHLKKHGKKSQDEKKKHPDGNKKSKQEESESESEEEEGDEDASMENAEDESEKQKDTEKAQPKQEDEEEDSDSEDEDEEKAKATSKQSTQAIALTTALAASNRHLPWAETFAIVPPTPLPFAPSQTTAATAAAGTKRKLDKTTVDGVEYDEDFVKEDEEEYVDIHDDLKREVAFYDNALEAVTLAREQCETVGIPFTRPEDFFAEMVKSDGE